MAQRIPIQLHVANALQWLGTLYRNPAEAIKEHVSNAIDEHLKATAVGAAVDRCDVVFTLDRRQITIDYPYGMSRAEFEAALQRVADSAKRAGAARTVGRLGIGFILIICVVSTVMYATYRMLDRRTQGQVDAPPQYVADSDRAAAKAITTPNLMDQPNAVDELGRPAAGPKLLTNEPLWLAQFRTQQREALTTYGWVDKDAGVVRLPIERAKQLIVERGLPQMAAPAAAPPGTTPPGAGAGAETVGSGKEGTPVPTTAPKASETVGGEKPKGQ